MIKTLKTTNGTFAALGNPQAQSGDQQASGKSAGESLIGSSVLVTQTAPTKTPDPDRVKSTAGLTLAQLANAVINDSRAVVPGLASSKFNQPVASFAGNSFNVSDHDVLAQATTTVKQFQPYEQLTGISQDRPEIVMMTGFLPIFAHDGLRGDSKFMNALKSSGVDAFMTDAGRFIDLQYQLRRLRSDNIMDNVIALKKHYEHIRTHFVDAQSDFVQAIDDLKDTSRFLLTVVTNLAKMRQILDLHHDFYTVDTMSVINQHVSSLFPTSQNVGNNINDFASRGIPPRYTFVDSLVRLGYKGDVVNGAFASTKIWLQLLAELKMILKYHSAEFLDQTPAGPSTDTSAFALTKSKYDTFSYAAKVSAIDVISDLKDIKLADTPNVINQLETLYKNVYTNVHMSSDELKIAAIANLLSQEFKYSVGLGTPEGKRVLQTGYAYKAFDSNNPEMFDFIFGQFGSTITDVSKTLQNSLAGLGQLVDESNGNQIVVLPFENQYLQADNGITTPGSEYYVEALLDTDGTKFNTAKLETFSSTLENKLSTFKSLVGTMNLASSVIPDPYDKYAASFRTTMTSAGELAKYVIGNFIDTDGSVLPTVLSDGSAAAYAYAAKDNRVKGMMFLLALMRLTQNYTPGVEFPPSSGDNGPISDSLLDLISERISSTVPTTDPNKAKGANSVDTSTLKESLKGDGLPAIVNNVLAAIWEAMSIEKMLSDDSLTRYGGHPDTVYLMTVFDLICTLIAKYAGKSVVGTYQSKSNDTYGIQYFLVTSASTNAQLSINKVMAKLDREAALTQQLSYCVFSTLSKLSNAIKGYVNFFKSPTSLAKLSHVSDTVGNLDAFKLFISEQQIMMFVAAVDDLIEKLNVGGIYASGDSGNVEMKILDDGVVSPALKQILYSTLAQADFTSRKGNNKRILTVGVPLGFARHLNQTLQSTRSVKPNKQSDIISVSVYKVDQENSDLIFKPQRFLFELSRFPSRSDGRYLDPTALASGQTPTWCIPTRDYGSASPSVEYALAAVGGTSLPEAMLDESYSFLSVADKLEILKNHSMSYLLETYIRLLTSVSVAEYHFDLIEPPQRYLTDFLTKQIVDARADLIMNQQRQTSENPSSNGMMFSPGMSSQRSAAGRSLARPGDVQQTLANANSRYTGAMYHDLRTINNMSSMVTSYGDGQAVSAQLMRPKQFDRVFNVIVDPDEFEIDVHATLSTSLGKDALQQLIEQGDVVPIDGQFIERADPSSINLEQYRFIERDKNESDLTFDKYFVVVETYDQATGQT